MKFINYLILFIIITVFCGADDFFSDLQEQNDAVYSKTATRVETTSFDSLEAEMLHERLRTTFSEVSYSRFQEIRNKMSLLEQASSLPGPLSRKYREQLQELQQYQKKMAARQVDSMLVSSISGSSPEQVLNRQAKTALQKLPPEKQEHFINSWKMSLVDGKARELFIPYVSMISLYGAKDPVVDKIRDSLNPLVERYETSVKQNRVMGDYAREEEADFVYELLKKHEYSMPVSIQRRLYTISSLEEEVRLHQGKAEYRKYQLKKIQWEKDSLIESVKKLEIPVIDKDGVLLDDWSEHLSEWFDKRVESGQTLLWPFYEKVSVRVPFQESPNGGVTVETSKNHGVRSPVNGNLQQDSKNILSIYNDDFYFRFRGDFDIIVPSGEIKRGDKFAVLKEPYMVEVSVRSTRNMSETLDLMELF